MCKDDEQKFYDLILCKAREGNVYSAMFILLHDKLSKFEECCQPSSWWSAAMSEKKDDNKVNETCH